MLSRRDFVRLLAAASVLPACAGRKPPSAPLPTGAVSLGWRLVPGMELAWRSVVVREQAGTRVSRAEEWSYLVRDLDEQGVATLEGRLTGFGAGADVQGTPLPDGVLGPLRDAERDAASGPVTLRLAMDGHLVSCSVSDFSRSLRHRLLALRVPATPVEAHDEWPDPGLVRHFADLMPHDLQVAARGESRLMELHQRDGATFAALEYRGSVEAADEPIVVITGGASWNTGRGRLAERDLQVRFLGSTGESPRPGLLGLRLFPV